jgi:hypothetical protein
VSRIDKVRALTLEMAGSLGVSKAAAAESAITGLYPFAAALVDAQAAMKRGNKAMRRARKERARVAREVAQVRQAVDALAQAPGQVHPTRFSPTPRLDLDTPAESLPIYQANGSGIYEQPE